MFTVIYYIHFGKDCQAVFPPNQFHLIDSFIGSLEADSHTYSRIDLDEQGNPIPTREEVIHV
jgi:hypothetical protein